MNDKNKRSKAMKASWSRRKRSAAMKASWRAKRKSAKMKACWARKKAEGIPFGKWKPTIVEPKPGMTYLVEELNQPMQSRQIKRGQPRKVTAPGMTKAEMKAIYNARAKAKMAAKKEAAVYHVCNGMCSDHGEFEPNLPTRLSEELIIQLSVETGKLVAEEMAKRLVQQFLPKEGITMKEAAEILAREYLPKKKGRVYTRLPGSPIPEGKRLKDLTVEEMRVYQRWVDSRRVRK